MNFIVSRGCTTEQGEQNRTPSLYGVVVAGGHHQHITVFLPIVMSHIADDAIHIKPREMWMKRYIGHITLGKYLCNLMIIM
jgi:hypothetical protein